MNPSFSWERALERVKHMGFGLAVDDLGSGYSALSMLAELQPDFLKVDMSIVRDVDSDMHKRRLVDLLCSFAEATDSRVVAEGVETRGESIALEEAVLYAVNNRAPLAPGVVLAESVVMARPKLRGL